MTLHKLSITPEFLLPSLIKRLLELRGAICWLDADSAKLNEALVDVLRKLLITQILHDKYVIAIGGLQGAGKTTLLAQLYGLDSKWIDSNEGRGEHFPMLILEDSTLTSPQGYLLGLIAARTADGEFKLEERKATTEEFKAALNGDMKDQVMPILKVPQQYFNGADKGFILLPGYEAIDEDNKVWQSLMRQTLIGSAMCVIVTDQNRLAEDQKIIRQDMNRYFEGAHPVIVISKTEHNTDEQNAKLTQVAAEVFGVSKQEMSSRVICSGNTEAGRNKWLPQFKNAIEKYSSITDAVRGRQIDHLGHVLDKELSILMMDIDDSLRKKGISSGATESVVEQILDIFDDANKRLKSQYRRELDAALNSHAESAIEGVNHFCDTNVEGWDNFLKRLGNWVKMRSGRNEGQYKDAIQSEWNGKDGEGFTGRYKDVLGQVGSKELRFLAPPKTKECKEPKLLLGYQDKTGAEIVPLELTDSIQHNLRVMFYPERDDNHQLDHLNKDFKKSVKLIPALGLEYSRIAAIYPDVVGVDARTLMPANDGMKGSLDRMGNDFDYLKGQHSKIIKGIATILAVDLAADGEIDTIPALFHAITGTPPIAASGGVAVATASTAATVVAGAVAIGIISICVINEVNRQNTEKRDTAIRIINAIRDNYREHYLTHYDQLMDELRSVLEDRLQVRYRLDEGFMHRDRLNKALADVRSLRNDLLGDIGERAPALV